MSERCLRQGSALAPATFDLLRLYSMRFCPFAQRTRLVLAHKRIPHEIINVNLKYKPSWFLEKAPLGLVPVIEYKGEIIYESAVCDEFLEERFPEHQLLPTCSFKKALCRMLMLDYDKTVVPNFYRLMSRDSEKREGGLASITAKLHQYDAMLRNQKTEYFQGDSCGLVDFHFWPWFERFPCIDQMSGIDLLPQNTFPSLHKWMRNMERLEVVQKVKYPVEWYTEFHVSLAMKTPDYDIGLIEQAKL